MKALLNLSENSDEACELEISVFTASLEDYTPTVRKIAIQEILETERQTLEHMEAACTRVREMIAEFERRLSEL